MRKRTAMVALVAAFIHLSAHAEEPQGPFRLVPRAGTDPAHTRTLMAWHAYGFIGADRAFDAQLAPPPGTAWPLYATDDIAVELADRLREGHPEIIIEICELVPRSEGQWASIADAPWLVRHPRRTRQGTFHEPCQWRGTPTGVME